MVITGEDKQRTTTRNKIGPGCNLGRSVGDHHELKPHACGERKRSESIGVASRKVQPRVSQADWLSKLAGPVAIGRSETN
jgi:hypothetical protein